MSCCYNCVKSVVSLITSCHSDHIIFFPFQRVLQIFNRLEKIALALPLIFFVRLMRVFFPLNASMYWKINWDIARLLLSPKGITDLWLVAYCQVGTGLHFPLMKCSVGSTIVESSFQFSFNPWPAIWTILLQCRVNV